MKQFELALTMQKFIKFTKFVFKPFLVHLIEAGATDLSKNVGPSSCQLVNLSQYSCKML